MKQLVVILSTMMSCVMATPYIGFPFEEQLPTIARQDTYYNFQLNNETFVSDSSAVEFELDDLPEWLSFDSLTRVLSGTPSSNDTTDLLTFTLVGTDDTGMISREYSIIVSADPGPELSSADVMFTEIATFGYTNGYNGLVLESGQQFTLNFSKATFDVPEDSNSEIVAYYGRSADRTSLPSWIKFNEETVSFYGTAPLVHSWIAPSFEFGFALIATDHAGYAGAIGTFNIVVGAHELSTGISNLVTINGTEGQQINYTIPFDEIYLDGVSIDSANISSLLLSGNPSWVSLDGEILAGTVPQDADSTTTFNFTLNDVYGNSIVINFEIDVLTSLFTVDSIPEVNATRGEYFHYTLPSSIFTDVNDTTVTATFDGDSDWITFHQTNLTFNGNVPDDLESLDVDISATKSDSSLKKRADDDNSISFEIRGVDVRSTSSSHRSSSTHHSSSHSSSSHSHSITSSVHSTSTHASSTSGSHSMSATSSASSSTASLIAGNRGANSGSSKKTVAIAVGVVVPVVVLIALAIILYFCCYKRRSKKQDDNVDSEKSPSQISGPILGNPLNNPNHNDTSSMESSYNGGESPRRLSTLNVMNLENNKEYDTDNISDVSSTTNVENDDRSIYQDAMQSLSHDYLVASPAEVPKRSWRRPTPRASMTSMDSVATEELFTVKAVDEDNVKRRSDMSMLYANQLRNSQFLGSSTSSILTKESMANFQRLDSDGNIVSMQAPYSDSRLSSKVMSQLHVLPEEEMPYNTTTNSSEYLSAANDISQSGSSTTSIPDEFRLVEMSNGDLHWDHINDSNEHAQTRSSSRYNSTMTFLNKSDSTMIPQRQSSTASSRARLVEFENSRKLSKFDPITDQGEHSDGSESAEISFMV